jgi:HSP20 family molecular chaperone IbpA
MAVVDDLRHLLGVLEGSGPSTAAECTPPLDVLDTAAGLEILVDLPGVPASAVQVVVSRSTILIAGEKLPPQSGGHEAGFHLAERGFGRFVRTVHFDGSYDVAQATASLVSGELRIMLPRIEERRGREIRIPIR